MKKFAIVVLALILGGIGISQWWGTSSPTDTTVAPQQPSQEEIEAQQRTEEMQRKERLAQAQAAQLQIKRQIEDAEARIKALETEMVRWEKEVLPLAHNSQGKRLAGDAQALITIEKLLEQQHATRADINAMRKQIQILRAPLDSIDGQSFWHGDGISKQIWEISKTATAHIKGYSDARQHIEFLLSQTNPNTESPYTLAEAIARMKQERLDEQTKQEAARQADREAKLAEVTQQTYDAQTQAMVEQTKRDEEIKRQITAQEAEHKRRVEEAKSPRVLAMFRPFVGQNQLTAEELREYAGPHPLKCRNYARFRTQVNPWPNSNKTPELNEQNRRCAMLSELIPLWLEGKVIKQADPSSLSFVNTNQ